MDENQAGGLTDVGTAATETGEATATAETQGAQPTTAAEPAQGGVATQPGRTFTQEEVNDLMRRRVERSHNAFFKRFGVEDLAAMDAKFAKIAEYEGQLLDLQGKNADLVRDNAFLRNGIDPAKYDDIKTYFKGLGEDFSEGRLAELIGTHPDWLAKKAEPEVRPTTITSLSPNRGTKIPETDDERMRRVFGI